ncbi:MAG: hypothetical protein MZU95_05115 [Desulfomicrobium escambiense]|nr:hypothetical protein [Desulfomicrobium escambiense]
MSGEAIGRVIIGGSDEAFSMVKGILNKGILEKVIGTVKVEMFAKNDDVIRKVEPVVAAYEKEKNNAMVKDPRRQSDEERTGGARPRQCAPCPAGAARHETRL